MLDQMPPLDRTRQLAELANWLALGVRENQVGSGIARDALKREMRQYDYPGPPKWTSATAKALLDSGDSSQVKHDHVYVITEDDFRRNDSLEAWLSDMTHLRLVVYVTNGEHSLISKWERQNKGRIGPTKYDELGIDVVGPPMPVRA
jgi:hypothetical protein